MEAKKAVELLTELVASETEVMKQLDTTRGITKKAEVRQRRAVRNLFVELVGFEPTKEQIDEVTEG